MSEPTSGPGLSATSAGPINPQDLDDRWFRAVANYTYDWESWHDALGRVVWVNTAVERITGYSPRDCLAMADYPLPLVAPADRSKVTAALASALRRTAGEDVEFRCPHRQGEVRWLSMAWQPMYHDGSYLGFRTSTRDVTDRHNLREQLRIHAEHLEQLVQERTARLRQLEQRQRQMEKLAALGQLAAGVAHEINNPLAGIRNAFQLIRSELPPDSEQVELIELVDREIERISSIILQMYQLYRPQSAASTDFCIAQTVREVAYLLEAAARKRNVSLAFTADDDAAVVRLPEGEVKQILYNLIRNAIQASADGDAVHIRLQRRGEAVEVSVQDRGPGIPAEIASRIFEPFFTTKQGRGDTGMGLGLSVSQSLIEAMGGRIDVAAGAGKGSRFTAVFPAQFNAAEPTSLD
ncbi:MAG: PAS domain-containing sensor histidine kinase [Planctomycetota bacterium]|nr:MAG: PAS domain-containing sensor histidine kinase [Planctomycetota bacterium]